MPRRSGRRTDYTWFGMGDVLNTQDLGVTAVLGTTGFDFVEAQTLMRVRGKVGVTLDAGGVNEAAIILVGLTIMSNDAFAGSVAPELGDNGVDDGNWLWQGALYVSSGAEASVDGAFPGLTDQIEIDSKVMRRVKASDTLAFILQSPASLVTDQNGTFDLTYWVHGLIGL